MSTGTSGPAPALDPLPDLAAPTRATCETYAGWEPDEQCGRDACQTVWVQCADDGPRERGICREHLGMLRQGVAFRCRYCAADLNVLHIGG